MSGPGIENRPLGLTGMSVYALGMGCSKLGAFWQGRGLEDARRTVGAARELGVDFFDTADCYARGLSERLLGRALAPERDQVVICTKVGLLKTPAAAATAWRSRPAGGGGSSGRVALARASASRPPATCFHPAYLQQAMERSLRRLGLDYLDLLLLHGPSLEVIQQGSFLSTLERAQRDGKVRHFGISCATPGAAQAALEVPGVAALQVPHNLCRPDLVSTIADRSRELGVALVATSPFGDGRLLGSGGDDEPADTEVLTGCLQFCLQTPGVSVVLVGMSRPRHVVANLDAATAPAVSPTALSAIRERVCARAAVGIKK